MEALKAQRIFLALRILLAAIIAAHGWARLSADAIVPFGTWLESQQIPLGIPIAYLITFVEIGGSPVLALGRLVSPICLIYSLIYAAGIALVHAPEGWFVVGLGRNGMEYSVLLIATLLGVGYWHMEKGSPAA
ncbi:MAG: DoxX family protein [Chloroflexota bacterium]